jgi:hypothetical protein
MYFKMIEPFFVGHLPMFYQKDRNKNTVVSREGRLL